MNFLLNFAARFSNDNASDYFFLRISDHISISCLYAQLRTPDTSSKKETGAKNDRKENDNRDMINESIVSRKFAHRSMCLFLSRRDKKIFRRRRKRGRESPSVDKLPSLRRNSN